MKLVCQDSQDRANFASELDALKTRLPTQPVSTHTTALHASQHDYHNSFTNTPFKMEIFRFVGTDALGWIFKINYLFNFHSTQENFNCILLFRQPCTKLVSIDV